MSLAREVLALILTAIFAISLFVFDAKGFGKQYRSYFDYRIETLVQINVRA